MHDRIIKLKPVFQSKIWGGERLTTSFGYQLPSSKIGECWAISAHPHGDCIVTSSPFQGLTLSQLYSSHRDTIFNETKEKFPLLVKIIDAHDDLSVQVHPGDEYALNKHNEFGKSEIWVILDCDNDAKIQIGHRASNHHELVSFIKRGDWNQLLRYRSITPGDAYSIEPGTIHALCKGTLLYEVQQSSDLTYRLYDYDRVDEKGEKRPLHIDYALDVINVPDKQIKYSKININESATFNKEIISNSYFKLFHQVVNGTLNYNNHQQNYLLISVLNGSGTINNEHIEKGDHFIIPATYKEITYQGNLSMIVTISV